MTEIQPRSKDVTQGQTGPDKVTQGQPGSEDVTQGQPVSEGVTPGSEKWPEDVSHFSELGHFYSAKFLTQ